MTLGEKVRSYRLLHQMSQTKLAELADTSLQYVGRIERDFCKPSFAVIMKICEALDVSPNELADWKTKEYDLYERRAKATIVSAICEALELDPQDIGEAFDVDPEEMEHAEAH